MNDGKTNKNTRSRPKATELARKSAKPARKEAPHSFPIIGIGASAGGLEALDQFFTNVQQASGMAFVSFSISTQTIRGSWSNCGSARPAPWSCRLKAG